MQEGNCDRTPDLALPNGLGHHAAVKEEVGDFLQEGRVEDLGQVLQPEGEPVACQDREHQPHP